MCGICNSFHVGIIKEIFFWSLKKFKAIVTLPFVCQLIFWIIKFSYFIKETRSCHDCYTKFFVHKRSLITSNIFLFWGAWEFKSFEAINLNSSSSLGWTFWKDNSRKRSLLKSLLEKSLQSLYCMILGFCFEWYTFRNTRILKTS